MADYDAGEISERERLAADRQKALAKTNADALLRQYYNQLGTYDLADQQNRALADRNAIQMRRKAEADRFEAARNLRSAGRGILSQMGPAGMQGSATENFMRGMENRSDADSSTYWNQLQENLDTVENSYLENENQNNISREEARVNALKGIEDIMSETSANLSNINPNLYEEVTPEDLGVDVNPLQNRQTRESLAQQSGYVMPQQARFNALGNYNSRNRIAQPNYFGQLMNQINRNPQQQLYQRARTAADNPLVFDEETGTFKPAWQQ